MNNAVAQWVVRWWRSWGRQFLIVALVVFSVRSTIADWNDVPTGSMIPTILEGDRIFVNKLAFDLKLPFTRWRLASWSKPSRGDVVVFFSPADEVRMVKRVVGLPGDELEMRDGQLLINGKPLDYDAVNKPAGGEAKPGKTFLATEVLDGRKHPVQWLPDKLAVRSFGPITVPDEKYFLMGDNRDNSYDSRFYGPVAMERIVGRATAVALSVDPDHFYFPRWSRFFQSLP